MNNTSLRLACASLLALLGACGSADPSEVNQPLITSESIADPHVIRYQGRYYLYGTAKVADHYDVFVSEDGLNWARERTVFQKDTDILWAPNVFHDPQSGLFYLYYSLDFNLGVARAATPLGPFEDLGVIVWDAIDANVLYDDGQYYLYYATANEGFSNLAEMGKRMFSGMIDSWFGSEDSKITKRIYVQPMASPTEPSGERIELLAATAPWEQGYSLNVVEGPWVFREQDRYYLMYSGSPTHESQYGVGYATAESPLGPFQKSPDNPILFTATDPAIFGKAVYGPGHHSVVSGTIGKRWIYFHQNDRRYNLGMGQRYTSRGELILHDNGKLSVQLGSLGANEPATEHE